MTFLPPSSDTGVMALLAMISNPEGYRSKLEEITTANNELTKSVIESRNLHQQLDTVKKEIEEQRRLLNNERTEFTDSTERTRKDLARQSQELEDWRLALQQSAVKNGTDLDLLSKLETQLNIRQGDLDLWGRELTEREEAVSKSESALDLKLQDYEKRVRRLKEIVD